jgi:hypothetical protein
VSLAMLCRSLCSHVIVTGNILPRLAISATRSILRRMTASSRFYDKGITLCTAMAVLLKVFVEKTFNYTRDANTEK